MIYKQGSIIPRRIIRCKHRKTQHLWTFGCDVEIINNTVKALTLGQGAMMVLKRNFIGGKRGKPKLYTDALVKDVELIGFTDDSGVHIQNVLGNKE